MMENGHIDSDGGNVLCPPDGDTLPGSEQLTLQKCRLFIAVTPAYPQLKEALHYKRACKGGDHGKTH